MGRAARLADRVVLTSDNCRDEDPRDICAALQSGLIGHSGVTIELDRAQAIEAAVVNAAPEDVVLVAGRGPERELLIGRERIPLVDADVVEAALAAQCLHC